MEPLPGGPIIWKIEEKDNYIKQIYRFYRCIRQTWRTGRTSRSGITFWSFYLMAWNYLWDIAMTWSSCRTICWALIERFSIGALALTFQLMFVKLFDQNWIKPFLLFPPSLLSPPFLLSLELPLIQIVQVKFSIEKMKLNILYPNHILFFNRT